MPQIPHQNILKEYSHEKNYKDIKAVANVVSVSKCGSCQDFKIFANCKAPSPFYRKDTDTPFMPDCFKPKSAALEEKANIKVQETLGSNEHKVGETPEEREYPDDDPRGEKE